MACLYPAFIATRRRKHRRSLCRRLDFICNVVINEKKEAIYAVAGDLEKAHEAGCRFLSSPGRILPGMTDFAPPGRFSFFRHSISIE